MKTTEANRVEETKITDRDENDKVEETRAQIAMRLTWGKRINTSANNEADKVGRQ